MFAIENKPVEECERKRLTRMLFTEELFFGGGAVVAGKQFHVNSSLTSDVSGISSIFSAFKTNFKEKKNPFPFKKFVNTNDH